MGTEEEADTSRVTRMRILITSGHLENFSGSKQWAYTVAMFLHGLHDVTVTSHRCGRMAWKMEEAGLRVVPINDLIEKGERFEFGIISQIQTADVLRHNLCDRSVYVSHGLGNSDKPLWDCDRVVAISEEVAQKWGIKEVVYNPINTERYWAPLNVLYISNHGGLGKMLDEVCNELGYNYRRISTVWEVEAEIAWADVVVSVGRGVLEAMSCGKRVIVADYRRYNGEPLADSYYNLSHNCSGRCHRIKVTPEWLKKRLLGNRNTILRWHRVDDICRKLLEFPE